MLAPEAIHFGPVGHALFGWLHRSSGDAPPRLGVVLCNPFGFEEVCAHRALRDLAAKCAAAGCPALRYDHPGCGDSAGDDLHDITLDAWVAAAHDAVQALRRATGVPQVVLVGLRLGAAIAWQAAAQREDVAGLVAIAPVMHGRAWLRELRLLGETTEPGAGAGRVGLLEGGGFALDEAGQESFGALDLRHPERAPAPHLLVVERDDVPVGEPWAPSLAALGASVEVASWPGYAGMVTDPQRAQTPQAMVTGIVATLTRWGQALPTAPRAAAPPCAASALHAVDGPQGPVLVRESATWIERDGARLFGMLAAPEASQGGVLARGGPAVLLLNAGSVHHIGPGRLWVRLARRWAARGLTVLRLDLAGLGDSPATDREDNTFYPPQALDDIRAAVTWLRRDAGAGEVHLLGLCSGAYHAYRAAAAGLPVASAVMVNPLTFHWRSGTQLTVDLVDSDVIRMTRRYRATLAQARTWQRLLRGELDLSMIVRALGLRLRNGLQRQLRALSRRLRVAGDDDDVATGLARAADAGVRLRFVFAAGEPGLELLHAETGNALAPLLDTGRVVLETVADADHTFTRLDARDRLVALLDRWAGGLVSARPAAAPAAAATLRRGPRAA